MSIAASVSVGNATATVRKSPHNFSSIGQLKYGCRVSLEDSAKVSRECQIQIFPERFHA